MEQQLTLETALRYAKRVANNMMKDPEADSIAGIAAWRAYESFNPSLSVPWKRYIAICTKREVWQYWRQKRQRQEETKSELFWEEVYDVHPETIDASVALSSLESAVDSEDWILLTHHYLDKWPLPIMCRKYQCSTPEMRSRLSAALDRTLRKIENEFGSTFILETIGYLPTR